MGAIHAVAAHFTLRDEPGMVVLPTGAGKTAVLMLLPYVLRATRVLVITPSQFVRNQIAQDYASLKTLKKLGALPLDVPAPKVHENKGVLGTRDAWEELREFDAVITTPSSASPELDSVAPPPPDLFDMILVDEAHHSPARTWHALIEAFPRAKTILFTATPFRRDRREIRARHLYTYPIQRAFEDEIYGEMVYVPVTPPLGLTADAGLAREAERILSADRAAGHAHVLMVRADSRRRADELKATYETETKLRLEVVHSAQTERRVRKAIASLEADELDGVICVNMLGEGFDLPRLKIAALHAPHRSLAVTLQFFGRFARVGDGLGDARFLAVPAEISGDLEELFVESDAWGRKIRLMGEEAVGAAVETQEMIQGFEEQTTPGSSTVREDVSLHSFTVRNHVKAHQVHGEVDLHAQMRVAGFEIERTWVNEDEATAVFLLREEVRPEWATTPGWERIEYQLVVVYWDEKASVLFICSSHREDALYKQMTDGLVKGHARSLSLNKTNRVLRPFSGLELFNVGIRNRATGLVAESYRQMSGGATQHSLQKSDAALYHRGHISGKGNTPTGSSTIGMSSLGKIWRLEHTRIPQLVKWCHGLAREIENPAPVVTGIAIDYFDTGSEISEIPEVIILAGDWDEQVYQRPWMIAASGAGTAGTSILDADLSVMPERCDPHTIEFGITTANVSSRLLYSVDPVPMVRYADADQPRLDVLRGFSRTDLAEYLTEEHLRFHFADGSVLQGAELFAGMGDEEVLFDVEGLAEAVSWAEADVDITKELEPGLDGCASPPEGVGRSIHNWLQDRLADSSAEVVVYDHRPGECADFVAVSSGSDGKAIVDLYHCKASKTDASGDRVADAFEVCGQAVKSGKFRHRRMLLRHLRSRIQSGSRFVKGSADQLVELLDSDPRHDIPLRIHLVQPGFPKGALSPKLSALLVAVNRGIVAQGCDPIRLVCSP